MLRGCSVILSLSVIKQESPPQPQEVCSADGADWLSLRIQSGADICWDQNPKADNLHTVWPSTQPCVCMSECYTLVSWSYLSFFHAERGRLGWRGHVAALLLQAVVRVEKFLKLHHISHSERTVIHTQSIKHTHTDTFDRWLRRRDTLPVPEEKHSYFVFRNVIFCVSPVRIPAVLSGWNRSYRAPKTARAQCVWYALLNLSWSEQQKSLTNTHTGSYCAP